MPLGSIVYTIVHTFLSVQLCNDEIMKQG